MMSEILNLSIKEFRSNHKRNFLVSLSAGILFVLILLIVIMSYGVDRAISFYAKGENQGKIYLLTRYIGEDENDLYRRIILQRAAKYQGKVVDISNIQIKQSGQEIEPTDIILEFNSYIMAEKYFSQTDKREFGYNKDDLIIIELFNKQIKAHQELKRIKEKNITPIIIILTFTSIIIFSSVFSHVIRSSDGNIILYHIAGAKNIQIISLYFLYILQICCVILCFIIISSVLLVFPASLILQKYINEWILAYFPNSTQVYRTFIGFGLDYLKVILCLFFSILTSFVLCLDQFSYKRAVERMKKA